MADLGMLSIATIGGGLPSLSDLGRWTVRCPFVAVFSLCLNLDVGQSGAPGVEDFGLCLTLDVGQSGVPGVEDFGLCLTLGVGQSGAPAWRSFVFV